MDMSSHPSYVEASADIALTAVTSFVDQCLSLENTVDRHRRLVKPVITPRFVPTCSDELLIRLGRLSQDRNLMVQSHMAESLDQVEWVRNERGVEDIEVFERVAGACGAEVGENQALLGGLGKFGRLYIVHEYIRASYAVFRCFSKRDVPS